MMSTEKTVQKFPSPPLTASKGGFHCAMQTVYYMSMQLEERGKDSTTPTQEMYTVRTC